MFFLDKHDKIYKRQIHIKIYIDIYSQVIIFMIQDIREFQIKEEKANHGVEQEW